MDAEIVGRDEELAQIDAFVALDGPRALLIEGEAGIGKTTLWRAGVERARASGHVVVHCAPSQAESEVSFAALGDLLRPIGVTTLEALPAPQRRALEGALLLRDPERPPEGLALGLGLVEVLTRLASEARLIVAIDDTQWLDAASREVLTFAARRLETIDFGVLMSRREGDPAVPLELERALPPAALEICVLGPMSLGALGRLVRERIGIALRRPELLRLEALSGGNPLFAVELAPSLLEGGAERLPTSLSGAMHTRLADLDDDTLDALLVAAVSPSPTLAAIEKVTGIPDGWERLQPAREAQIVTLDAETVRFVHPLYAAAMVERASPKRIAEAHKHLAALAPTRELRARHLAASVEEPDEELAADIEAGARDAMLRGAPEIGAELAARARELTPDASDGARARTVLEAQCLQAAGDLERGRAVLSQLANTTSPGPARAELLFQLAQAPRNFEESIALCERALDEAAGTRLAGGIGVALATSLFVSGHVDRAVVVARAAIDSAAAADDEVTEWRARAALAMIEGARGSGWDLETLRRAADLEIAALEHPDMDGAALWLVQALHFNDLFDEARTRIRELREWALHTGDAIPAAEFLAELATVETRSGHFETARDLAVTVLEELEQIGWEQSYAQTLELLAQIDAWLGREDDARAASEHGVSVTRTAGEQLGETRYLTALIVLELGAERWESAAALAEEALASSIITDPSVTSFSEHGVEAHAVLGNLDRARELTEDLEVAAADRPTPRLRMEALRCRGLVVAAEGDPERAIDLLRAAAGAAAELGLPHQRGRTLLMLGRVQRRARHKAEARASLEEAIELLDEAGARLFAAQARRELARVGGRAPAGDVLTVTERRVAELVAEGRSNKEVAAALFVTVKAVEANLSRIYAKLGIHSRTELAHLLSSGSTLDNPPA